MVRIGTLSGPRVRICLKLVACINRSCSIATDVLLWEFAVCGHMQTNIIPVHVQYTYAYIYTSMLVCTYIISISTLLFSDIFCDVVIVCSTYHLSVYTHVFTASTYILQLVSTGDDNIIS